MGHCWYTQQVHSQQSLHIASQICPFLKTFLWNFFDYNWKFIRRMGDKVMPIKYFTHLLHVSAVKILKLPVYQIIMKKIINDQKCKFLNQVGCIFACHAISWFCWRRSSQSQETWKNKKFHIQKVWRVVYNMSLIWKFPSGDDQIFFFFFFLASFCSNFY